MKDAVEICKTVSALEAGAALGLDANRDGRCACPVHHGSDRNCKLYPDDRGYYCYVCHAGGDVISLTMNVLECTFQEAIKWLSDTFRLGVDIDMHIDPETLRKAKKRAAKRKQLNERIRKTNMKAYVLYLDAADTLERVNRMIERHAPKHRDDPWDAAFCAGLRMRTEAEEAVREAEAILAMGGAVY